MLSKLIERILGPVVRGTNLRLDAEAKLLRQPTRPPQWPATRTAAPPPPYNKNVRGRLSPEP